MMSFISRPRIVENTVEERAYQTAMADGCLRDNSLIILPTGLGKTIVALMVASDILEKGRKVLFLAPTKPLVEQHYESFTSLMTDTVIGTMNGNMAPAKRISIIENNDVIICTPQVVENDIENERYGLNQFGLIIFDEAHRAVGNYAYVAIADSYHSGLTMGMTASPGSDINKITEICNNLGIERVDIRNDDDPDVSPYIHDIFVNKVMVNMPEDLLRIIDLMKRIMEPHLNDLIRLGFMDPNWPASTKHLLVVGESLQRRLARGEKTAMIFRGLISQSVCIKMLHAIGLAETQGMSALRSYIIKLDEEASEAKGAKASKEIVRTEEFKEVWHIIKTSKVEHPKISKVMTLVSKEINSGNSRRIIVFSQYRDTCDMLVDRLSRIENVKVAKLIGQSKGGLKQKEQIELLENFRNGTFNTLVSTSVGEEGLDVASTDMVIFYEPVPSEIRTIQRRGRTGRKNSGEVYVLIAKDTRDEIFERTSERKEDDMREHLLKLNQTLKKRPSSVSKKQTRLGEF